MPYNPTIQLPEDAPECAGCGEEMARTKAGWHCTEMTDEDCVSKHDVDDAYTDVLVDRMEANARY